jgi:iron-sulfur cluster repair protein YtfE (RIC family)
MNAAGIMAALNTVEQDHRLMLDQVQALKETVCRLVEPEVDTAQVLRQLREIGAYLATELETHMEEEETTLFPLLEWQGAEGSETAAGLRREHDEIRRRRAEFDRCLSVATDLEDGPPRMVLWDLVEYGWDLWEYLDRHAHTETQAVRRCATRFARAGATRGSG